MTAREKLTIDDLNKTLNDYIEEDKEWKKAVEAKLNPLVDSSKERAIIEKYSKKGFMVIMAILGFIAAVGVAYSELQRLGR